MASQNVQVATDAVRHAIERMQGPLPPPFVVEFLMRQWRRYLVALLAEDHRRGEEWLAALATMEWLLWSVVPKAADEQSTLLRELRQGLDALRAGMHAIGTDDTVVEPFFKQLEAHHRALLQPAAAVTPGVTGTGRDGESTGSTTVQLDVHDPRYRRIMDLLNEADVENIDL